jgi:DNA-binding NarL/FixJ family response regulator
LRSQTGGIGNIEHGNIGTSEGTVKNHVSQILSKLEMRDRTQAALWAQQNLI